MIILTKIMDGKNISCKQIILKSPIEIQKPCIYPQLIPLIRNYIRGSIIECPNCKKNNAVLFYGFISGFTIKECPESFWVLYYGCLECGKIW